MLTNFSFTKREVKFVFLVAATLFFCVGISYSKKITINSNIVAPVYGNGNSHNNGQGVPDVHTESNSITLPNNFSINGNSIFGASNINNAMQNVVGNKVTVNTIGTIGVDAVGGESHGAGSVTDNVVEIIKGRVRRDVYGGRCNNNATAASGNLVKVVNGTIVGDVFGCHSNTGLLENNMVEIDDGNIGGNVNGGFSDNGDIANNTVKINNGTIGQDVHGGFSNHSKTVNNTVEIFNGNMASEVYGGFSGLDATGNKVKLHGGTITNDVYGGRSTNGAVLNNVVEINNGAVNQDVHGGRADNAGIVSNSVVKINNGTIGRDAYGGYAVQGYAFNNIIEIGGGVVARDIYAGYSNVNASGNEIKMYAGDVRFDAHGGYSLYGSASNNNVDVYGGSIGRDAYAGYSALNASSNKIKVYNGAVLNNVHGGYSTNGSATNNIVEISYSNIGRDIYAGHAAVDASGNKVTIYSGRVAGVHGGHSVNGSSNGNTVEIFGGDIAGHVYGGSSVNGPATSNTVSIDGAAILSDASIIYGGYSNSATADVFTNNSLNLKTTGITVADLRNFEYYNFYGPRTNEAMISVGNRVNLNNVKISVSLDRNSGINVNDKFILIKSTSGITNSDAGYVDSYSSVIVKYDLYILMEDPSELAVVVSSKSINPQTRVLSQGGAASGLVFAGQGLDFIANKVLQAVCQRCDINSKLVPFALAHGGTTKYSSDSSVDMEGVSVVGGLSKHFMDQRLMLGAFGEYGDGKYNTLDTIMENNLGDVTSRGIISYVGGGILGRLKIDNIYMDVSGHAGNSSGDFNSCDIGIGAQEEVKYNYEVMYYGAHLGCGYILKLGNKFSVDVNGKFLLTHQEDKNITLSTQDNIAFSQANLGKIRLGVRSGYKLLNVLTQYSDLEHEHMKEVETKAKEAGVCVEDLYTSKYTLTPYLGLGYEYEFFGKIEAKSTDLDIPVVDLRGGNAIGEIGVTSAIGQFNIDCSVFGYKGLREGVDAMLKIKYYIE
ncbi:MAG: autotransporter outer membrane beta-barrel domain-containing protein [Endomicrobium sp.]|jgi:hypothetical protein|nr:autotransporter outer membrane beta-barrel domain-containing protein [Endomicrobium sp.]